MKQTIIETSERSPDWFIRRFEAAKIAPAWLGLGIAIAYPLFVWLVHLIAEATIGTVELPYGPAHFAANIVVMGVLFGLLLACGAQLHLGALADLKQLRPMLSGDDDFERLVQDLPNLTQPVRWMATIAGLCGGFGAATLDPTFVEFYKNIARTDPRYIVFVSQNMIFGGLAVRLFATEVHLTRSYAILGEQVKVDLLDLSQVLVFARKGLRSVVSWVLVSSTFTMFWVLDSAGQSNIAVGIASLALITMALVAPTVGIHRSIKAAKQNELALLSAAIRVERACALAPRQANAPPEDARLGNLIQYQAFVNSLREWPFDLSIASRSFVLIVLGAGSWLGGAVVERALNLLLD
jgi:hypothetical protein